MDLETWGRLQRERSKGQLAPGLWGPRSDQRRFAAADRAGSVLQLYRGLISLRRSLPALREGNYETLAVDNRMLAYARHSAAQRVVVALNFASSVTTVKLPSRGRVAIETSCRSGQLVEDEVDLPACSGVVVELE